MKKKKLYIIGNGFDLHHGLPTKVNDFQNIIKELDVEEIYANFGVLWTDFEEDLSQLDIEEIYDRYYEGADYSSDRESDREGVIQNMEEEVSHLESIKKEALDKMIEKAVSVLESKVKTNNFSFHDYVIINFNYTPTIEKIYLRNDIFYIHGKYSESPLIFGFKNESNDFYKSFIYKNMNPDSDKWLDMKIKDIQNNRFLTLEQKEYDIDELMYDYSMESTDYYQEAKQRILYDLYNKNKKSFQYKKLIDYLKKLDKSSYYEVFVLGHHMGDIDSEYFEIIETTLNTIRWNISQYGNDPDRMDLNNRYSFKNKIKMISFNDLKL